MNIIAVDDERPALNVLTRAIMEAAPECDLKGFTSPADALAFAEGTKVEVAFLDVRMGGMDGIALCAKLKKLNPKVNFIYVTGYEEYVMDAFRQRASGYLVKPVTAESVAGEMKNLRYPPKHAAPPQIRVQAFGNFEVFVGGAPLIFKRSKSKEILAYLIDRRGASVTKKELASVLWEDEDYSRSTQKYLQILIHEMLRALNSAGAGEIVSRQFGSMAIVPERVECDYYRWLGGDREAGFQGEYMTNYSWGEVTTASLCSAIKD